MTSALDVHPATPMCTVPVRRLRRALVAGALLPMVSLVVFACGGQPPDAPAADDNASGTLSPDAPHNERSGGNTSGKRENDNPIADGNQRPLEFEPYEPYAGDPYGGPPDSVDPVQQLRIELRLLSGGTDRFRIVPDPLNQYFDIIEWRTGRSASREMFDELARQVRAGFNYVGSTVTLEADEGVPFGTVVRALDAIQLAQRDLPADDRKRVRFSAGSPIPDLAPPVHRLVFEAGADAGGDASVQLPAARSAVPDDSPASRLVIDIVKRESDDPTNDATCRINGHPYGIGSAEMIDRLRKEADPAGDGSGRNQYGISKRRVVIRCDQRVRYLSFFVVVLVCSNPSLETKFHNIRIAVRGE